MGKREENRELRKAHAVDAAYTLIAKEGVEALSLRRLASAAGLAVNTLYGLFESREGILEAVIEYGIARRSQRVLTQGAADGDVLDRLDALVAASVREMRTDPLPARSVHRALAVRPELRRIAQRSAHSVVLRILRDAVDDGSLRDDVDLPPLTDHMVRAMMAAMGAWAHDELDANAFSARLGYELSLAVLGVASDAYAATAREHFADAQRAAT